MTMLTSLTLLVAAVGWITLSTAEPDIVSKWKSYGGDEALSSSASVMVFCSCDVTGPCNITMAAQFYLNDDPNCYPICEVGAVQCAYCSHLLRCSCNEDDIKSYRLCRTGNRAKLWKCYNEVCTALEAMPTCSCDIMIVDHQTTQPASVKTSSTERDDSAVVNKRLLTGLAIGGGILLLLVLVVIALLVFLACKRRPLNRRPSTRRNTTSSVSPVTPQNGIKGVNNPTYDNDSRLMKRTTSAPQPSTTSYLYPYAPRLAASREQSTSHRNSASPHTSTPASSYYQELTPRAGDQPPTYEDSEGYNHCRANVEADPERGRPQPVYMELVRPSDRSCPRPPVDTYMY